MKSERASKLNCLVKSIGEIAKEAKRFSRIAECQHSAEVEATLKVQSSESGRIERCLTRAGRLRD